MVKEIKERKTKFILDREKDLLTKVLGNDEYGGRTRGLSPSYPLEIGFPKDKILIEADREQISDGRRRETGSTSC